MTVVGTSSQTVYSYQGLYVNQNGPNRQSGHVILMNMACGFIQHVNLGGTYVGNHFLTSSIRSQPEFLSGPLDYKRYRVKSIACWMPTSLATQCPRRFQAYLVKFLVFLYSNRLHVVKLVISQFSFIQLRYILYIPLKRPTTFLPYNKKVRALASAHERLCPQSVQMLFSLMDMEELG